MPHPWRPDLEHLSMKELYDMLPKHIKMGVDRVVWEKTKKLPELGVEVEPKYLFSKEDMLYLFDPLLPKVPEVEALSEHDKKLLMCAMDPVTWVREFLKYEPRIYQILLLRCKDKMIGARIGRRAGKTFSLIIRMLHSAITKPNFKVIVVTPYLAQADLMYADMWTALGHGGLKKTEEIKEAFGIQRTLRKPAEIYFDNGSVIRFFTAGAKTGGNADAVRGQEADLLILDELDYFGDSDLSSLTPMLQDTSEEKIYDKVLIASSTPDGRRDMLYALIDPDNPNSKTKEYWFSCFANPLFNKESEELARSISKTKSAFEHEYLAIWGDVAVGVFRNQILSTCSRQYKYQTCRLHESDKIILGMDWDKYGAGVNLCIIQQLGLWAKEDTGKYKIIQRYEIPRDITTDILGAGVREAVKLDSVFNFDWIYTDRGYGERQFEELVEALGNKVIGVNYGSSVEELDPIEGIIVREPLKPFAVDNAASIFERGQLIINQDDEEFIQQLLSYRRIKVSSTGRPIFGTGNPNIGDHAIDAMCFALLGFKQQYGDLIPKGKFIEPRISTSQENEIIGKMVRDPSRYDLSDIEEIQDRTGSRKFTLRSETNSTIWGKKRKRFIRSSW